MCVDVPRNSTLPPCHLPPAYNQPQGVYNDTKQKMTAAEEKEFAERLQRSESTIYSNIYNLEYEKWISNECLDN